MKQNPDSNLSQRPRPPEGEDFQTILRMTRERNRPYVAPRAEDLSHFKAAGLALFKEARIGRTGRSGALFHEAGFELALTSLGNSPAFAVRELPAQHIGGGVYFIRQGVVPRERVVQVPHSFFDMGTLEIGIELANAAEARALFVNTVHRYQGGKPPADDEDRAAAVADLAHQEATFFQRLTSCALETLPQVQVIQVHGFGDGAVPENTQASVVVSPGVATAGAPEAARVAARLAAVLGRERVMLYPRDTRKFGAQTNVQGQLIAAARAGTFLHIEMSHSLRNRLRDDGELRRAFVTAVIGGPGEKP